MPDLRGNAWRSAALLTFALAPLSATTFAQQAAKDYSLRPIRLVVPYAAGGPMDYIGYHLGQKISQAIGQNTYIDNRTGGGGNTMHFAAESFSAMAGIKLTHVPYKGVAQANIDLLAGRIDVCFVSARSGLAYVRDRKLRALGITAPTRWNELADVPTVDEAGVKGHANPAWYGFWFPAGTPADYVNRIHAESARALDDPAVRRKFVEEGFVPVASTPQEFTKTILADVEANRRLVQRIGLTPQ